MHVEQLVTNHPERNLLHGVRRTLDGAEEAYLCVAFASRAGVELIKGVLSESATLVVTTTFGTSTPEALAAAQKAGVDVRVMNVATGTYHPKVYVARRGSNVSAIVGSANLTGGLINNVEVATLLEGDMGERELAFTLEWARDLVRLDQVVPWVGTGTPEPELLAPGRYQMIVDAVAQDPVFRTVQRGAENIIHEVTTAGVWVETEKSRREKKAPQLVPAWMIQFAWEYLVQHGELTNKFLRDGPLSVKRSSFVCALLARLPGVTATGEGVQTTSRT